jgi:hypothetical protein
MDTLLHWFAACVSVGMYTLAFSFFKARQFKKRINIQKTIINKNKEISNIHTMTTRKKTEIAFNTPSKILPLNTSNIVTDSYTPSFSPPDPVSVRTRSNKKKIIKNEKNEKDRKNKKNEKMNQNINDELLHEATKSLPSNEIQVGDDFSLKNNTILFLFNCFPLLATIYVGWIGSKALGPWIVIAFFHFLYVGTTYRGAPEMTGCREILEKVFV